MLHVVAGVVVLGQPRLEVDEVDEFLVAVVRQVKCAAIVLIVSKWLVADVLEAARVLVEIIAVRMECVLHPWLKLVGPAEPSNQFSGVGQI